MYTGGLLEVTGHLLISVDRCTGLSAGFAGGGALAVANLDIILDMILVVAVWFSCPPA